jgi:fumarate reductase flavoprotein subunit
VRQTIRADLVIIGAGIAGLATAQSAAEAGARVVLVEKTGSFSARGHHNGAIGSKLQKKNGIHLNKEQILGELIRWASNRINQKLLRIWADHSGEVLDYFVDLAETHGLTVDVAETHSISSLYRQYATGHQFRNPGESVVPFTQHRLVRLIEADVRRKGVEVHYSTPAEQLVREPGGRVSGAICRDKNGAYVRFHAGKAVILATGDYGSNDEMLRAWAPFAARADFNTYNPAGANTGDGIKMAMWLGAWVQDPPHPAIIHAMAGICSDRMSPNQTFLRVNRFGVRYENEAMPSQGICNGRLIQPGNEAWGVFDSKYQEDHRQFRSVIFGPRVESVAELEDSVTKKFAFKAESLEGLAQVLQIPAHAFCATVARYNELARRGEDLDFGKDPSLLFTIERPPFYAARVPVHLLVVVGGLNVNEHLQVLDGDEAIIPGLYAVGNVGGNFFANDYPLIVPGLSHGRCLTFGRILGQTLARSSLRSLYAARA